MDRCGPRFQAAALLMLLVLHACTGETVTEVSVSEVEVFPPTVSAIVGESVVLSAVVRDELGEELGGATPIWSSDNPGIAEVDGLGRVQARSSGRVQVRATYEGVSGTSEVRVFSGPGIGASSEAVVLLAAVGLASPSPELVYITNVGTGTLEGLRAEARHPGGGTAWLTARIDRASAPASLTLSADSDDLPAGVYTAEAVISSTTPDIEPLEVSVTLRVAGMTVQQTAGGTVVSESGSTDSLTLALGSAPTQNVVVQVRSGDAEEVTVSPGSLTFTPTSWSTPQTVTLAGVDDPTPDRDQTTTVTLSVDDGASDAAYDLVADLTVSVTTTDDDVADISVTESGGSTVVTEAGQTDQITVALTAAPASNVVLDVTTADPGEVTVSPARLIFTPSSWSTAQSVTVTGADDVVTDGDQITGVTISVDAGSSDGAYDGVASRSVDVTTQDDDAGGISVSESGGATAVSESGSTDDFTVVLTSAPAVDVIVDVASSNPLEAGVSPSRITYSPGDWSVPRTVTVTGVDDAAIDGDQTTIVTISVDAAASDDAYDAVPAHTVSVTTSDDDQGGLAVTESGGVTTVGEGGTTDDLSVALTAAPATDVVLDVTSSDPGEATVSPSRLTFSSTSWSTPQTVTVSGVDDASADGDQITTITVSVDPAASDDDYDGVASRTVSATTTDDDQAAVAVTESGGSTVVSEAGGTNTVTVALTAAPASDVVLDVTSSDTTEATVSPTRLAFTPATWSTLQTVTVTGVDDAVIDGDQTTTLTISVDPVASDDAYDGAPDQTVTVTTIDDDLADLTLTVPPRSLPGG